MKTLTILISLFLFGCATAEIVPLGTETYMLSQTSAGGVFTNMGTLQAKIIGRAHTFAKSRGKVAVIQSINSTHPLPGRLGNVEIQFLVVYANDTRAKGTILKQRPDVVIENITL